jgi:hypothetical protein
MFHQNLVEIHGSVTRNYRKFVVNKLRHITLLCVLDVKTKEGNKLGTSPADHSS